MPIRNLVVALGLLSVAGIVSAETVAIAPGPDAQLELQEALILAEPGTVIELAEGTYDLTMGLSLDVDDVTIRGKGLDKTVLSFKNQDAGAEGLLVTSDGVTLEDFAFEDAKGNCFKSNGAANLTLRNIRTEWTNGPDENNGAYGLYPVSSENVLIEGCVAIGASDAGIYVGQTKNVIVRDSRAEYNVAGIEIENCHGADVYNCVATNNTGGILVFDLPGLPMQKGHDVRVFDNKVYNNDTPNFAPKGNIVSANAGFLVDQRFHSFALEGRHAVLALHLVTDLVGLSQSVSKLLRDSSREFHIFRFRLPVPLRLARFLNEFVDRLDHRLHLLVGKQHRTEHLVFSQLVGF